MEELNVNNLHQTILDNVPYHAWLKGIDGRYIIVNRVFARNYNLRPEDIVGKTDFDFCPKELALEYQKSDEEIRRKGKGKILEQIEHLSTGRMIFETYKAPLIGADGKVIGITGISREISDHA